MSAFYVRARTSFFLGLAFALSGCAQQAERPADREDRSGKVEDTAATGEIAPGEDSLLMKETLEGMRQTAESGNWGLSDRLTSARTWFREVRAPTGDDEFPSWTKVRLNTSGARFDAIRFTNRLPWPADLVWAFALPEEPLRSWSITPQRGVSTEEFGFTDYHHKYNLKLPGLDLPVRNFVVFQQLEGKKIFASREYFLWFIFEDEKPVDVYVKLKLVNAQRDTCPHFTTAHPAAEQLGIELPFQFTSAASVKDRDTDLREFRALEAARESPEKELANASAREADFFYARLAYGRALQLAQKQEDRDKVNRYVLKAAESMRALGEKYGDLEPEERRILASALYSEACTLAMTGQPEKGLESLQGAVQAGYDDIPRIRGDVDLQPVRDLPAFDDWFKELDDARQSPAKPLPRPE